MRLTAFVVASMVGIVQFGALAQSAPPSTAAIERIRGLNNLGEQQQIALADDLSRERADLGGALLTKLRSESKPTRAVAAYLLGYYRMTEGVDDLANIIDLTVKVPHDPFRQYNWTEHPAVDALIRIGNASIPPVLENLATSDDRQVRELSASVIKYVDGPDIGRMRVLLAVKQEKDEARRAKLRAALEYFPE